MAEPTTERFSLLPALQALGRHKWKMMAFFLVTMTAVTLVTFLSPKAWRSQAKLFVRLGRENVTLDPTTTFAQSQQPVVAIPHSREAEMASVIELLRSRVILEKVVDRIGPEVILGKKPATASELQQIPARSPAPKSPDPQSDQIPVLAPKSPLHSETRNNALRTLAKKLDTEVVKNSNVMVISYEGPSPEVAQAVVAHLIDCYLDQHVRLHRNPGTQQFLQSQASALREQLRTTEEALQKKQQETAVYDYLEQRRLLLARVGRLEDELLTAESGLDSTTAESARVTALMEKLPEEQITGRTTGLSEALDRMREQLYLLQLKELELLQRHPEDHPAVKNIREQAAAARDILNKEKLNREQVTTGPHRTREEARLALLQLEPRIQGLTAKRDALKQQLQQEQEGLKKLNRNYLELARLQRELDLHSSQYRKYAESTEQARIDEALQRNRITNVNVAQPASFESEPVRPRKTLNLAIGLVLAMAGSVGLAWMLELFSQKGEQGTADDAGHQDPSPESSEETGPSASA